MFVRPALFHDFLDHHSLIDDVYRAMQNPDMAELVMTAFDLLKKTNNFKPLIKETKSENESTAFRKKGNKAFVSQQYQEALICYNKALLYAPKYSQAMKLAYSNRSALLIKFREFSACLKDIEMCFSMGCPSDLIEKLRKRELEAQSCKWMENDEEKEMLRDLAEKFFHVDVKHNPQIPCASINVGVVVENQGPKIVATNDIKAGAVLTVETAFVSQNSNKNNTILCCYCHKMDFNLIPCDNCCRALFCSEECRNNCLREYHRIQCKITEELDEPLVSLAVIAVLKIKYMCKSWKEFVSASYTTGMKRVESSSINQMYDSSHKFSLLSIKDEKHYLHGMLYNMSFTCASILNRLERIGFLSQDEVEIGVAKRAFARFFMFLTIYSTHKQILSCVSIEHLNRTALHHIPNYGWFSFIGKLKHSCDPNVLTVGLNKKMALVAKEPIKKGTELTVSFAGHWLEKYYRKEEKQQVMFKLYGIVCTCIVCTEEYKLANKDILTEMQKKNFKKIYLEVLGEKVDSKNILESYAKLCRTLAFLSDVPFSNEYKKVFSEFRCCILYMQHFYNHNIMLDLIKE